MKDKHTEASCWSSIQSTPAGLSGSTAQETAPATEDRAQAF